jgi:ATP synthase protein I
MSVFRWQAYATVALTLAAGAFLGWHGALSAVLGGLVGVVSGAGFVLTVARSTSGTPGNVVATALRAEAVKIVITIALLWLVLATYRDIVAVIFIAAFIVSVLIFSLLAFARVRQIDPG